MLNLYRRCRENMRLAFSLGVFYVEHYCINTPICWTSSAALYEQLGVDNVVLGA